jgi:two-component system, LuxR family, response regulator FixJ
LTVSVEPQVVVIDDDEAVLDSLEVLLVAEGLTVATYNSARAFLQDHERGPPACLVTDVRMPEMDGLELIAALKRRGPLPPVIVITGHGDVPMAVKTMKLGARDFIEKPFDPSILVAGIREALAARSGGGAAEAGIRRRLAALTPRERQVLDQLVIGRSNKAIARELGISPRTVEIHRARVMEKMQAGSLSQLVRMAFVAGVEPGAG